MDYEYLKQAIKLLTNATKNLEDIVSEKSINQANHQTVEFAQETIKKAMAEISAAINPPIINHIPDEFLAKAESLGIPLDDVEVIVAISEHHPSQLLGVLAEIENRAENIRRRREYFLLRLPEMPIEKLGSRLPVIKASDFNWPEEPISQEYREAIKAKYKIDRLMKKRPYSRATIFEKIKQAEAIFAESQERENEYDLDEEIPF
ncbi:MAG: hypothetical protein F6K23_06260 [Okeania sp. SIO2C9]|uniref:hypothetical protein n=1 Tax=Okeania sp. SIO2C9 TaxID=2607791 RepID=UPI0013C04EDF|nr:hypothetical protein [Okeania sp. SIO2C9]NEQ72711.1 hypothetical protein [Okeania sp. SIO2C9]